MARLFGTLVSVLFAIGLAVVTWPQFFRVETTWPIAQIVAMRGLMVAGLLVAAFLFLLLLFSSRLRGWAASMLIIALLGAAANAGILWMRGIDNAALPAPTNDSIRVMSWNTLGSAVTAEQIANVAVRYGADIIALPETTEETGEEIALQLREVGMPMWVHHVQFNQEVDNGPEAWSTTLLITPDLGEYSVIADSASGRSNTSVLPSVIAMPIDGSGPVVVAVHAMAPRQSAMQEWRDDLRWMGDQCPANTNVIMLGDFNATLDHMFNFGVERGTLGACTDAAAATGTGGVGTWPTDLPALLGSPIDHVMVSKHWVATGAEVLESTGTVHGSDHRPIIVQLEPSAVS